MERYDFGYLVPNALPIAGPPDYEDSEEEEDTEDDSFESDGEDSTTQGQRFSFLFIFEICILLT